MNEDEVRLLLEQHGLRFHKRSNGLVVVSGQPALDTLVKAVNAAIERTLRADASSNLSHIMARLQNFP